MREQDREFLSRALVALFFFAGFQVFPLLAQNTHQAPQAQPAKAQDRKAAAKQQRALEKELDSAYKNWLDEVRMILSDDEVTAFLRLSTNEEREQYIEIIWRLRDPTPDTVENEFKEEHYRRIAFANERFSSGIPGWKTDRGLIYIMHGPPDETETHAGGSYNRPYHEGGGTTSVFPFEKWRYRNILGLGSNIELEFVDRSQSGEFRLEWDPSAKDALTEVPGAGQSDCEAMGLCSKTDRFQRGDGTRLPRTLGGLPANMNVFDRIELQARIFRPPAAKTKELDALVSSRLVRSQIRFTHRFDFIRVTDDTVLVPISVQIANNEISFKSVSGVHSGVLNIYGRVVTLGGRTVQSFEDVVKRDFPASLLEASLSGASIYQKSLPLAPGLYRLDLIIKDVNSGDVGALTTSLRVPRFETAKLESSSLILADEIEQVPARQIGIGQFVIGASKVRPRLGHSFSRDGFLGIWLQFYNLTVNPETKKSSATIDFRILSGDREIRRSPETNEQLKQFGSVITIEKLMPLDWLPPGNYKLSITVTDLSAAKSLEQTAEFSVFAGTRPKERTAKKNQP